MSAQDNDGSARKVLVRGNLSKGASFLYWTLMLLAFLSLCAFSVGILLAFIGGILHEPVPAMWAIVGTGAFLCLALSAAMRSMEKRMASKTVASLLPIPNGLFILTEEGVYLTALFNLFTRTKWYTFHPWAVLSIGSVDEEDGCILLKKGKTTLRLIPAGKKSFRLKNLERMIEIIRSHVSVEVPVEAKAEYKWGRVVDEGITQTTETSQTSDDFSGDVETAPKAERVLHIRLTADLSRGDIKRIMEETKHDASVRKAAFWSRLTCFLIRLSVSVLNIIIAPLFIYSVLFKFELDLVGVIVFGALALLFLQWVKPGIMQFISAWALLFLPFKRGDILNIAKDFRNEFEVFPVEWGRMRVILAPYVANRITMKQFKSAWKGYAGSGIYLSEQASEKLEIALRDVRQAIACSRCGAEAKTYRTMLPWTFGAGEVPPALMECPHCKAVSCGECRGDSLSPKCPQCGGSLNNTPAFMHFEEHPAIWIDRNPDRAASKDLKSASVIEEIGDACKKLELNWSAFIRFDAPIAWSEKGKAKGERPKDANSYPCIVHMQNYWVEIEGKWYLAQGLPPDGCTAEWAEVLI